MVPEGQPQHHGFGIHSIAYVQISLQFIKENLYAENNLDEILESVV